MLGFLSLLLIPHYTDALSDLVGGVLHEDDDARLAQVVVLAQSDRQKSVADQI